MTLIAKLVSVQVGQPAPLPGMQPSEKTTRSAIFKNPVDGPLWLGPQGLEGDTQADRRNHGGPTRAVNVYPAEHYELWRQTPGLEGMAGGAFGENFTTLGLLEDNACIGDVYHVGEGEATEAVVAITQPRGPCYKLNRRWQNSELQERAEREGRIGWYLRVVQEGRVQPGQTLTLVERPNPTWTIARVWSLVMDPADRAALEELVEVPGLSSGWREMCQKMLAKKKK